MQRRLEGVVAWLATRGLVVRLVITATAYALAVAIVVPLPRLVALAGILGVVVGTGVGLVWRRGVTWRLPGPQRAAMWSAIVTGVPSGDVELDWLAVLRLEGLSVRWRRDRSSAVLAAGLSVIVLVGVSDVRSWWWAFAVVPILALALLETWWRFHWSPDGSLAALKHALAGPRHTAF